MKKQLRCWHCRALAMHEESKSEVVKENAWVRSRVHVFRCMECGKASNLERTWWSDDEPELNFEHVLYAPKTKGLT
jgi:uncharacterized Zn finger protein